MCVCYYDYYIINQYARCKCYYDYFINSRYAGFAHVIVLIILLVIM